MMPYTAPLSLMALSGKGKPHLLMYRIRTGGAMTDRINLMREPTFGTDNLHPDVTVWLNERKIRPTRIFAHQIEFEYAQEAFEFKMRWS